MACIAREEIPECGVTFGEIKRHRAVFGLLELPEFFIAYRDWIEFFADLHE
jgi:hypothetical protein